VNPEGNDSSVYVLSRNNIRGNCFRDIRKNEEEIKVDSYQEKSRIVMKVREQIRYNKFFGQEFEKKCVDSFLYISRVSSSYK
jgi:hypothetical protein